MLLRLNQRLSIFPLDVAERGDRQLIEVSEELGRPPRRYAVPTVLIDMLREFNGQRTTESIIDDFMARPDCLRTRREMEALVLGLFCERRFVVPVTDDDVSAPETDEARKSAKTRRRSYLQLHLRLIPGATVGRITPLLKGAFSRFGATSLFAAIIASHILYYVHIAGNPAWASLTPTAHESGLVIALMIIGAFAHEFGHATAATFCGCVGPDIGIGQYLHLTVLYTDLSEAWRLTRRQRVLVDIGGVYFQIVFASVVVVAGYASGSRVPGFVLILTDIAVLATLNPFFRLDGYWLFSDMAGIINLRDQVGVFWSSLWRRMMRRSSPASRLSPSARAALAGYAVLSSVYFAFITYLVVRRFQPTVLATDRQAVVALWHALSATPVDGYALWATFRAVLWRFLMLLGVGLFAWGIVRQVWRHTRRVAAAAWRCCNAWARARSGAPPTAVAPPQKPDDVWAA